MIPKRTLSMGQAYYIGRGVQFANERQGGIANHRPARNERPETIPTGGQDGLPPGVQSRQESARPLLTPGETEVMQRVVRGQANKVIALDLGVSQRTVELHRARVMRKLKMRSLAELVTAVGKVASGSA